jgi:hypothetical protein
MFLAVGFAAGLAAGSVCQRQNPPARPPLVELRGGHVTGTHPPRDLKPLSLRAGDEITKLGESDTVTPHVVTVYLVVSGVPVVADFELPSE